MNDPCGLVRYDGRFLCYYQWNQYGCDHSHKDWGLFASEDLVRWSSYGPVLAADESYDKDGVYTGTAIERGGRLLAYYAGNARAESGQRVSSQCLAVSDDGESFRKVGPVVVNTGQFTGHFRDPCVFERDGGLLMLIGAQRTANNLGALALSRSRDGYAWSAPTVVATSREVQMIECPDLLDMEGGSVLTYCCQYRDDERDKATSYSAVYKAVDDRLFSGSVGDGFLDEGYLPIDEGFDFYAPQVFRGVEGRVIMCAWMSLMDGSHERAFCADDDRLHCLTIPREVTLVGGALVQRPVRELFGLIAGELDLPRADDGTMTVTKLPKALLLTVSQACVHSLDIVLGKGTGAMIEVTYDVSRGILTLKRTDWMSGSLESRSVQVASLNDLEAWVDATSVELFVNGGSHVLSARMKAGGEFTEVAVQGIDGHAVMHAYKLEGGRR